MIPEQKRGSAPFSVFLYPFIIKHMKTVILGAGRRGVRLARHLVEENRDVVILDEKPANIEKAMSSVDCIGYVCSATSIDDLREAGVGEADAFIALTGSDEINLVSCGIVASTFNVPLTIASVRNLSYTTADSLMGISHIVNPYQVVADHILQEINQGIFSNIINFEDSTTALYNVLVTEDSKLKGIYLRDIKKTVDGRYIVAAVNRAGKAMVPNGDTLLMAGDELSVVIGSKDIEKFLSSNNQKTHKTRKIAIVGSTKVTDFLLHGMTASARKQVTVISKNIDDCQALSEKYPNALIVNDNIASEGVFRQEHIDSYDLFISVSDNDELNLIAASYAKSIGVKNSMALLSKTPDYIQLSAHLGIDSLISSQDVTADSIMQYLHGKSVSSLHTMFNGQLLAIELKVKSQSRCNGLMLKDINMKGRGIIAGIKKGNGETVIPNGFNTIETSDTLIMVIEHESLEDITHLLGIEIED